MSGKKITTLAQLARVREKRLAITVPSVRNFEGPMPAAFAMNLTGDILFRLMRQGMFIYKKEKRSGKRVGNSQ